MDCIFPENIGQDIAGYLEDLLIHAFDLPQIHPIFARTLGQLIDAGLKCQPRKCEFFPASIHHLGHVIQKGPIAADESKLGKIREWPFPSSGTEMASFLVSCNYYSSADSPFPRRYSFPLQAYVADTSATLGELRDAFHKLKRGLCDSVALHCIIPRNPLFSRPTRAQLPSVQL